MSNPIQTVSLEGFRFPDFQFTVALAAGITTANCGQPVAWDDTAANQVKIAGDDDVIVGELLTVENRVNEGTLIGTVGFKFARRFTLEGAAPSVGDSLVGSATEGTVKVGAASATAPRVAEVIDATTVVATLF